MFRNDWYRASKHGGINGASNMRQTYSRLNGKESSSMRLGRSDFDDGQLTFRFESLRSSAPTPTVASL